MTQEDPKDHSINELWKAQNQTQKEVGEMRSEVSAIKAGMEGLTRGFTDLAHEFRRSSQPKQFNWGWLISGIVLLGVFIGLYVNPVQKGVSDNSEKFRMMLGLVYDQQVQTAERQAKIEEWVRIYEQRINGFHFNQSVYMNPQQ